MGMTEDDKRNCCLLEIQETEAKYYKTLEDIEKVRAEPCFPRELWDPTWIVLGWFLHPKLGNVRGRMEENGRGGGNTKPWEAATCRRQNQHLLLWLLQIGTSLKTPPAVCPHPGVRISHSWLSQAGFADKSCVCRYLLSLWLPRNNSFIPSAEAVLACHWS